MKYIALLLAGLCIYFMWTVYMDSNKNVENLEAKNREVLREIRDMPASSPASPSNQSADMKDLR